MFMYATAGDGQLQEQEHRYHGIAVPMPTPKPTLTSAMEHQQHVYVSFANKNCRHNITQLKEIRRHLTRFFKAGSMKGFLR